jgi:hypothetical protein
MTTLNAGNVPRDETRKTTEFTLDRRFASRTFAFSHAIHTECGPATTQGAG